MLRWLFATGLIVVGFATSASAQVATGTYQFGAFDNHGVDIVNVGNLNVHLTVPVLNKAGRGLPFYYNLSYDSSVWVPAAVSGSQTWTPVQNWGWRGQTEVETGYMSVNALSTTPSSPVGPGHPPNPCTTTLYSNFAYHDAFGVIHPFPSIHTSRVLGSGCTTTSSPNGSQVAIDGSGYTLNITNSSNATVISPQGRVYIPPFTSSGTATVTDSNGNQVSANGSGGFTDTLGQTPLTIAGNAPSNTTFTYKDTSGNSQQVTMSYTAYTVQTAFGCSGVGEYGPASVSLVSAITFADQSAYHFTYEPTPGVSGAVTGRLASVTLPAGGVIAYAYSGGSNGIECSDGSAAGLKRTMSTGTTSSWSYARTLSSGGSHTAVVDGDNNNLDYDFVQPTGTSSYLGSLLYQVNHNAWNGSGSAHQLSQATCYNASGSYCVGTAISLPITQVDVYRTLNDLEQNGSTTKYNSYGEVTEFEAYDYGASSNNGSNNRGAELSTETWAYGGSNAPAYLVSSDTVSVGGSTVSQSTFGYDQTTPTSSSGVPSHVAATGSRGNLTSSTVMTASGTTATTTMTYEDTGSMLSSTDPVDGKTTYSYDSTFAFATGATLPTPSSGVAMSPAAGYDTSYTGVPKTSTDVNGQVTTHSSYDSLLRPTEITYPDGGKTVAAYSPTGVSAQLYQTDSTYVDQETKFDAYGRVNRVAISNGSGAWYQQDTCYDGNGNVAFMSYPYTSSADTSAQVCSGAGDTYSYDVLGRQLKLAHGDGSNTSLSYLYMGRAYLSTDEGGVSRIYQSDGVGRSTLVCEETTTALMGVSPVACGADISGTGFVTKYAYDPANHRTTVTQTSQTRVFQTDWIGRPVSITEPERGTTTYAYSQNSTGLVVTRQRPQANQTSASVLTTTTKQYDVLDRPLSSSYNDNLTPTRSFIYDQSVAFGEGSTSLGFSKGRMTRELSSAGNGTGEAIGYDPMGRIKALYSCRPSICGSGADTMLYTYDEVGNMLTSTDGNNVSTTYKYTTANQLMSATSSKSDAQDPATLMSNVTQGPFGPVSFSLGNGVSAYNTYDTMGRWNGRWVCSGAGAVNCSGSTQLDGSNATWQGVRANASTDTYANKAYTYGYDGFNRLTSTSVGGSQTYSYGYDLYGNRTSQTPGPSVSFNSANQMTGFPYDAAGNMLKDAAGNSYTYDAEGNVIQVTGTSVGTVKYTYDGLNRRVRVDKGSTYQEYDFNANGQRASIWNGTTNVQGQYYLGGGVGAYYTGGATHFQHKDWLGTERIRTTYNGTVEGRFTQLAFGDGYTVSGTDTDDAHYASLDYDAATQSSHAQFRELDLIHGRWFSPDPYDGSYDLSNPQSFNRYNYALNNPVAAVDPSGLDLCDEDGDSSLYDDPCGGDDGGGGGGGGGGGDQGGGAPGSGGVDQPTPGCENGCVDQNGNTYQPTGSGGITDGDSTSVSVNGGDPNGISLGFLGYGPAYNGTFSGLFPYHGFAPNNCISPGVCNSPIDNHLNLMEKGKTSYRDAFPICSLHVPVDNATGSANPHLDLFSPTASLPTGPVTGNIPLLPFHLLFDALPDAIYRVTGHYLLPAGRGLCQ